MERPSAANSVRRDPPPGEYRPLYDDAGYYYYQAPSKVVLNDLTSLMFDGGIYLPCGTTATRG